MQIGRRQAAGHDRVNEGAACDSGAGVCLTRRQKNALGL